MNKKLIASITALLLFAVSSAFSFSLAGKKYKVIESNGQDLSALGQLLTMTMEFTEDTLIMTISSYGESESMDEKYSYDDKTKTLTEYPEDGSTNKYKVQVLGDKIVLSGMGATMVLQDITNAEEEDDADDYEDLLNSLIDALSGYEY